MAKKKTDKDWWIEKLQLLANNIHGLDKIDPNVINKIEAWALIKLIILGYFIPFHSTIIKSGNNRFQTSVYIDLFSGCGINQLELIGHHYNFTGSPIVAVNSCNGKYDKFIFNDSKKDYVNALNNRLEELSQKDNFKWLKNKFDVLSPADVNKQIKTVIEIINQFDNPHSLIFIDPYGMNLDFDRFKLIFENTDSDIIFYFNSEMYMRQVNAGKKGN